MILCSVGFWLIYFHGMVWGDSKPMPLIPSFQNSTPSFDVLISPWRPCDFQSPRAELLNQLEAHMVSDRWQVLCEPFKILKYPVVFTLVNLLGCPGGLPNVYPVHYSPNWLPCSHPCLSKICHIAIIVILSKHRADSVLLRPFHGSSFF